VLGDVFDDLTSLVDKSLVLQKQGRGGAPRFGMLETVREFAAEQLAVSGEEATLRDRHAAWVLDLAPRNMGRSILSSTSHTMAHLTEDHANLRTALEWLERTGRSNDLLRLTGALASFWYVSGLVREGQRWLTRAYALAPAASPALRVPVLEAMGHNAHFLGDDDGAAGWLTQAAELARRAGDAEAEADGYYMMGIITEDGGDHDRAETMFREALERYERDGNGVACTATVYHLGIQAFGRGEVDGAIGLWHEAAAMAQGQGNAIVVAWTLEYRGLAAAGRGDLGEAAATLGAASSLALGTDDLHRHHRDLLLAAVAVLAANQGMAMESVRLLGAAQAEQVMTGFRFHLPESRVIEDTDARARVTLGEIDYTRGLSEGRVLGRGELLAEIERILARARTASGEPPDNPARRDA